MKTALASSSPTSRGIAAKPSQDSPVIQEIDDLTDQLTTSMRASVDLALRIGFRLLHLYRTTDPDAPGGFSGALARITDRVARPTAYRWMNAASNVLANHQCICAPDGSFAPDDLSLPEPGTTQWTKVEKVLSDHAKGTSLRRLLIGSSATGDESRLDELITRTEAGDHHATAMLDKVAAGELTLVQAIRAASGAAATKNKERHDPIYLDIDGTTGQLKGLFPRCVITLSNTFARWDDLDEAARTEARKVWKTLAIHIPKELR